MDKYTRTPYNFSNILKLTCFHFIVMDTIEEIANELYFLSFAVYAPYSGM